LAQSAKEDFLERKQRYEDKLRVQQSTIERDNKYLNAGKKMLGFVDRYVTKSRRKDVNQALVGEVTKYLAVEKAKLEDIKLSEKLKAEVNAIRPKKKKIIQPEQDPNQRHKIGIGSTVKLISTKQNGTVESIDGENLTVTFGFMRMKVEKDKLMWIK
jgi:DNA mismatch repair protein MutS2